MSIDARWSIVGGPRIAKQFREAMRALHRAGQVYEIKTDDGSTLGLRPFLPTRREITAAEETIGGKYEWVVNAKNYIAIIEELKGAAKSVTCGVIDERNKGVL